jgi:flagellar protein FlaG
MSSDIEVKAFQVSQPSSSVKSLRSSETTSPVQHINVAKLAKPESSTYTNTAHDQTAQLKNGNELPVSGQIPPTLVSPTTLSQDDAAKKIDDQVGEVVRSLNELAQNTQRELKFSIDDDTGRTVVKVMDLVSKELIRQIPSEEILELAKTADKISDLKGNLIRLEV